MTKIDPVKVKAAVTAARAQRDLALAEHERQEAYLSALGTVAGAKEAEALTVAFAGGRHRVKGGGTKRQAVASTEAAFRYSKTAEHRETEFGKVQKAAFLSGLVSPHEISQMRRSYEVLRRVRERLISSGVYVPVGNAARDIRGEPGSSALIHAEILIHGVAPYQPIGVSRETCAPCRTYFVSAAASAPDGFIVISDPTGDHVFADGECKKPEDFA